MPAVLYLLVYGLYAAAEASLRPDLAAAPLLVHDGREVVDMSPAAAKEGVRPGQRLRQAEHRCPGIKRVQLDVQRYRIAIRALRDAVAAYSPRVEPLGDQEILVDLTGVSRPTDAARRLVGELLANPGWLVAAGLASSRLVAKVAGGRAGGALLAPWRGEKGLSTRTRDGYAATVGLLQGRAALVTVASGQEAAYLAPLGVEHLWPLPRELRGAFNQLGLSRIGDLARMPESQLLRRFGPLGSLAARYARGIDLQPVASLYPPAGIEERRAFEGGVEPGPGLQQAIGSLARAAGRRLEAAGMGALEVLLRLEAAGGSGGSGGSGKRANLSYRRSFSRPQSSPSVLGNALRYLLNEATKELAGVLVETVAAEFTELRPLLREQLSFLDEMAATPAPPGVTSLPAATAGDQARPVPADDQAPARLDEVLAALGRRYPRAALRLGRDLPADRRELMLRQFDPLRRCGS